MDISGKQPIRRMIFGERLAQARINQKLSQETLAEAVGTTARSISRWEHNQTIPQQYYLERLCNILQTTPEVLFGTNTEKKQEAVHSTSFWHVPYARNPYFTGRKAFLQQLYEQLHAGHQVALTQPHFVSGLGGIGKTQTALEYLYVFRHEYQSIFWISAETYETLISSYLILAQLFQLPEKESTDQIIVREAVKRWFQIHNNWLLVFDNVENLELLQTTMPTNDQGHILITTRSQITGTLGIQVTLSTMDQTDGMLLFLRRAKLLSLNAPLERVPALVQKQAASLVDFLDGLPLALDQAGAYIEETGCTLTEYLERYTTHRKILLNTRGTIVNHHPASVVTTFSLALRQVEQISPAAADLLRVCAFLHAEAIPEELFARAGEIFGPTLKLLARDPLSLDAAIRELRRFSLVQRDPKTKSLSMHRLLQAIIQDGMSQMERQQWIDCVIKTLLQVFPGYNDVNVDSHRIQTLYQQCLSHALTCIASFEKWNIASVEAGELLYRIGCYLQLWGDDTQAVSLLFQATNIAKKIFGASHSTVAFYLNGLAILYMDTKQYAQAEIVFQQVLDIYDKIHESDQLKVAESLWCLASLLCLTGRYVQAQSLAQQALAIKEQALGKHHYQVAQALNVLGMSYMLQEKYTQSEQVLRQAVSIYEETLGKDHFFTASSLRGLGLLYAFQGRSSQAVTFYQQALQIYEQKLGPDNLEIALVIRKLGKLFFVRKEYQQAQISFSKALKIFEKFPKPAFYYTAYISIDLGELLLVQGHIQEAHSCLQRALVILGETRQIEQVNYQEIVQCLLLAGDHLLARYERTARHVILLEPHTTRPEVAEP